MIAWPGVSGANGFAAASSCGPEALWMMPEMPLPASKVGLAESTKISALISKIELYLIVSIMKFYGRYVGLHNLLWEYTILIDKL